jgi:triacylglycerol lipase
MIRAVIVLLVLLGAAFPAASADRTVPDFAEVFRLSEAYWSMRYAPPQETRAAWGPSYDELAVVDIPSTENRYMIGTDRAARRQDIWVRGTANLQNALADMEVAKRRSPKLGINLHRGFEDMALAVYRDILPRLEPGFSLVIFGHSLGAAEASILGLMLQRDAFPVARVYASGSPRLTDAAGAAAFASLALVRIVNEGDPVPVLPPRTLVSPRDPYVHIGDAVVLLDGPYFCRLSEQGKDDPLAADFWRSLKTGTLAGDVKEHFIQSYIERLRQKTVNPIEVPAADRARYGGKS